MPGDQPTDLVDKDRVGEAERRDRGLQLFDLPPGMGAGVARVRRELGEGAVDDAQWHGSCGSAIRM